MTARGRDRAPDQVLRTTAMVDAPPRAVAASVADVVADVAVGAAGGVSPARRRGASGSPAVTGGPLAPGDELCVPLGCVCPRLRVVAVTPRSWRAVLVGECRRAPALVRAFELSVLLAPTAAGVLVTGSAVWRAPGGALAATLLRGPVLDLLTRLTGRIGPRAEQLAGARVVVGAAIVATGPAGTPVVLAARRTYPADAAGRWELPGGGVEAGEHDRDAVRRECVEELGVDVLVDPAEDPVGPDVALGAGRVLRVYRARLADPGQRVRPREHAQLRWLTAGRLGSVDWLPADRVLLPALRALLSLPAVPED